MTRIVFVHGAGRAGASAWPKQQELTNATLCFVERAGYGFGEPPQASDFAEDARRVVETVHDGAHVVGHSYGAIAALTACRSAPDRVHSLALFEPACFSLARGRPAVEAHVRAMAALFEDAATLTDEEFLARFLEAVGAEAPSGQLSADARESVRRLRLQRRPWEADLDPEVIGSHPTLVVTSGASALSEEVAAELEQLGAAHVVIEGSGHRPQDTAEANILLREFWRNQGRSVE